MDPNTRGELLTGAPGALALGGKRWLVRQPTEEDMGTMGLFLHKQLKARGREFPKDDAEQGRVLVEELCSVEGVRLMAWLLLKDNRGCPPSQSEIESAVHEHSYLHLFAQVTCESGMAGSGN